MKIAFLLMSGSSGFGGHHVSAFEIMNGLRNLGHECRLLSFGAVPSRVFSDDSTSRNFTLTPIDLNGRKKLAKFIKSEEFDAFFPMDETSCRILISVYPKALSKTIPVKPGWINVSSWTNLTKDFVCFSKENYEYMRSLTKYNNVSVHLVPNRVSEVKPDEVRIRKFCEQYGVDENEKVILAVSRIDPDKLCVFHSAKILSDYLNDHGFPNRLFIIGSVSSEETLKELKSEKRFEIVTDTLYTKNVSQLFGLSCAVVAMGRTSMESLSLGIPTFVPTRTEGLPILITEDSFEYLLQSNFTYRAILPEENKRNNINDIMCLSDDVDSIKKMSKSLFLNYLDVEAGAKKYSSIAQSQEKHRLSFITIFRGYVYSNIRWFAGYLYNRIHQFI